MHKHLKKLKCELNFPNGSNVVMKSDAKPEKRKQNIKRFMKNFNLKTI